MQFFVALGQAAEQGPEKAQEAFDAGKVIIGHVSNSSHEHALISLPTMFGIDFSVTKHVFMLWVVAATIFVAVTAIVRRSIRGGVAAPGHPLNVVEIVVEFVRDSIVEPNLGHKW